MNPGVSPIGAVSAILLLGVVVGTSGQLLDGRHISSKRTSGDGSVHIVISL